MPCLVPRRDIQASISSGSVRSTGVPFVWIGATTGRGPRQSRCGSVLPMWHALSPETFPPVSVVSLTPLPH